MSTSTPSPTADVLARVAEFTQLGASAPSNGEARLESFTDIPITLTARLGQSMLTIGEILKLGPGSTVGLDREVRQPVDLVVGGKVFARGEVVVVDDRFAVRIKELAVATPAGAAR
jgi:flagellar motor switch protein FliN/FliY